MLLVTGSSGFVGKALCDELAAQSYPLRRIVRKESDLLANHFSQLVRNLDGVVDWSEALVGVTHIVHLAARVHHLEDTALDPVGEYRRVNVDGTLNLARQAIQAGVKRFVFVSSVKVNGESTKLNCPFTSNDLPAPEDSYGISKYEAEQGLLQLAKQAEMEIVIVRPPLVYGPGVKANFERMMRWVSKGLPLPFGAIVDNRRSFVALDNLVDLLIRCIEHPRAAGQIFMVSDDEDLSTKDLLLRLGRAMERPAYLVPVPLAALQVLAKLVGQTASAGRLFGNLQVDIGTTKRLLDWRPKIGVDEAMRRVVMGRIL